jgi:hypothetical protein
VSVRTISKDGAGGNLTAKSGVLVWTAQGGTAMKRVLIPFATVFLSALLPAAALGKGASQAEIIGPGLADPIVLAGEGQAGGERLVRIAEAAGFFAATFGQSPDPMLDTRPTGSLGPRYRITYLMPGPNNELDVIKQDLYPYAEPTPVSYTPPKQPFFGTEETRGGWYVASTSFLEDALVQAGLPKKTPTGGNGSTIPWMVVGSLAAIGGVLLLGAVAIFVIRRRPQAVT